MRTFREIAREIKSVWAKPYFGAQPYIDAMMCIWSSDPNTPYIYEDARSVVCGFLANASTFRGERAKQIKAELKSMIR